MSEVQVAPYGAWKSPITAELIASQSLSLMEAALDGDDIYWLESRPLEGGRYVIVRRRPDGQTTDINPAPFNARTRVHEYGGAPFLVFGDTVFYANFADNRLYRQDGSAAPRAITPPVDMRYADLVMDRQRGRIIGVREDHTGDGEAVNTLVSLDPDGVSAGDVLVAGADFYASPRLSPDGKRLAWLAWNHPNMPWDGTELLVGTFSADGTLGAVERVAGGVSESIFQPEWSPDGALYFVSDRSNWWNLYRWRDGRVEPVVEMEAEFGLPLWVFGMSTYAFESAARIVCTYTQGGVWHLATIDTATRALHRVETPYTHIRDVKAAPGRAVFMAASPTEATALVAFDPDTGALSVLRRSADIDIDPGYLSPPEAIAFPTEHGLTAHAFFYPPRNRDFTAPAGERPPLIVFSHGGPTGATSCALSLAIQFWTSRGFAVADVNYGGSTGYGCAYRQRLVEQWGVVDVDDCVNAARYLVERGDVDGERLIIRGGSAGGYTTLNALTFRDVFRAGASYFGIGDLSLFVGDTHKFESRYLDRLIGPYPECAERYYERSAINYVDQLSCPVIFFQGLEDKVVPPNQAEVMVSALREKGIPVAYVPFEGEQHGFRRAENIKRSLEAELYFYAQVFGFPIADAVEPVQIQNL